MVHVIQSREARENIGDLVSTIKNRVKDRGITAHKINSIKENKKAKRLKPANLDTDKEEEEDQLTTRLPGHITIDKERQQNVKNLGHVIPSKEEYQS